MSFSGCFFFLLPKNAAIAPPFKFFFIWLYIVGHPFKKYILFGWTYKNAAIAPPLNFFFFFFNSAVYWRPYFQKIYILFGWTYSRVFENAAIGPPFKNTYGPIAIAPP